MENLSAGLWSPVSGGVSCAGFPGGLVGLCSGGICGDSHVGG